MVGKVQRAMGTEGEIHTAAGFRKMVLCIFRVDRRACKLSFDRKLRWQNRR